MKNEKALTPRQQEVLNCIQQAIAETGAPPTRAEIASKFKFASPNAAEEHLRALQRKGVIDLKAGTSRGIRLKKTEAHTSLDAREAVAAMVANGPASGPSTSLSISPLRNALQPMQSLASDAAQYVMAGVAQLCLPLVGRVAAGSPILAQEHVQQHYYVQEGLFTRKPDYLLKVHGESMRDVGIMEGDLLAVQSIQHVQEVRDGQIVVVRIDDDVTVKTLRRNRNNTIELHPANPNYEIRVVQAEENFAIEGVAVGLIRNSFFF